jgi:hypothetical protein
LKGFPDAIHLTTHLRMIRFQVLLPLLGQPYLTTLVDSTASAAPEHSSHDSARRANTRPTHAASLKTRLKFQMAARGFSSTQDFAAALRGNNP